MSISVHPVSVFRSVTKSHQLEKSVTVWNIWQARITLIVWHLSMPLVFLYAIIVESSIAGIAIGLVALFASIAISMLGLRYWREALCEVRSIDQGIKLITPSRVYICTAPSDIMIRRYLYVFDSASGKLICYATGNAMPKHVLRGYTFLKELGVKVCD